jgi:ATPase subunit of ABC transporter with duplicated ATPase domains
MDEPTNYLDIAGQEQFEEGILSYEAMGVLVSHDRTFVESTGTRFLVIENEHVLELDCPEPFYQALALGVALTQLVPDPRIF